MNRIIDKKMKKKGQTTLFIIIGIVIVAVALLIYFFVPSVKNLFSSSAENPYDFIQKCIEDDLEENIALVSSRGGSIDPEHYIVYNGENIEYLCYTNEYYKQCVMQQPMLKEHIEKELNEILAPAVTACFNGLESYYDEKGYGVNLRKGGVEVELLPKRVVINFNHSVTLSRDEQIIYDDFKVVSHNNLYELISIANSILNWEARYGDSETTDYMNMYHDLKVEKKKQIDGSTIYILTDRNTENKFQFASRSVAWPPGYE